MTAHNLRRPKDVPPGSGEALIRYYQQHPAQPATAEELAWCARERRKIIRRVIGRTAALGTVFALGLVVRQGATHLLPIVFPIIGGVLVVFTSTIELWAEGKAPRLLAKCRAEHAQRDAGERLRAAFDDETP